MVSAVNTVPGNQPFIFIAYGNGDGTFSSLQRIALPASVSVVNYTGLNIYLRPVDLNHDQHIDLLYADMNGNIATFLGNGDGTFQPPNVISASSLNASGADIYFVADLNQDSFPDLILASAVTAGYAPGFTTFYASLGDGHGGFGAAVPINLGVTQGQASSVYTSVSALGLQDLNSDGFPDLVLHRE